MSAPPWYFLKESLMKQFNWVKFRFSISTWRNIVMIGLKIVLQTYTINLFKLYNFQSNGG